MIPARRGRPGISRRAARVLVSLTLLFCPWPAPSRPATSGPAESGLVMARPEEAPRLEIRLLGGFQVLVNDIAVPETILKQQKASQKATESKAADLQKKREVR